jgi:hypothetical protein
MELTLNTVLLLAVAGLNAYTAYISHRTEKNTNSMKDALVKTTGELAHATGLREGRDEARPRPPVRDGSHND